MTDKPEIWNRAAALERLMNNAGLLDKICELFIRTSPAQLEAIKTAAASTTTDRFSTVQAEAHALKGASGNIGAEELMQLCSALEQSARSGNTAQLQALSLQLDAAYRRLLDRLPSSTAELPPRN